MARHLALGKKGERLAYAFLVKAGYNILDTNWRFGRSEIDIVAEKNGAIHFIEVKTRSTDRFGYPETGVTLQKMTSLLTAAVAYQEQYTILRPVQCDILAITLPTGRPAIYFLIEDVFF